MDIAGSFPSFKGVGPPEEATAGVLAGFWYFSVVMMRSYSTQHHLTADLLLGSDRMTVNGTTTPLFALS